jgi:hypothetical protein
MKVIVDQKQRELTVEFEGVRLWMIGQAGGIALRIENTDGHQVSQELFSDNNEGIEMEYKSAVVELMSTIPANDKMVWILDPAKQSREEIRSALEVDVVGE